MQVILDSQQLGEKLSRLADEIALSHPKNESLAIIGIRSRGEHIAERLQKLLQERGLDVSDRGTLDITLYRDDINQPGIAQHVVKATEIDFDIEDRIILLVDDVLSTGRSIRAALSVLVDNGRAKTIRAAVLIDRGCREMPISADYVAMTMQVPQDKLVQVYLSECDDRDEVVIE